MASKEEMSRIGKSNVRRGKSNERAVAKLLAEWTGKEFRRRRVEGRDATVVERESTADVIPVKGEILFSIEVKCGECPSIDGLLANPINNKITKWWHQATYDANLLTKVLVDGKDNAKRLKDGKYTKYYPLLFFKPGNGFNWIAIDREVFALKLLNPKLDGKDLSILDRLDRPWMPNLLFDAYDRCGEITHDISHSRRNKEPISLKLPSLYFIRWKDFEASVEPSSIFI